MKSLVTVISIGLFAAFAQAQTPDFKSGDIIFHTSTSNQSQAIMFASNSPYSHVGIIEIVGPKKYVIEAISTVSRTPFDKWIARGRQGHYTVLRYQGLDEAQQKQIVTGAKEYLGRGYDIYFTSQNKEIYCSELVSLAFTKAKLQVGQFQKVKDLNVDNVEVRKLVEKRWRNHPLCRKATKTFEECWSKILEDDLVTPDSQATDPKLKQVFTNYP